ncbi:MAG: YlmC/YmxH family sporulation protein [Clostridia bacterium]|nr:YlmC/YmxH family sporulation protein [Clostridia bacterium]
MARGIDFKQKEVVSISDGKILGFVVDVNADFENGEINSIVVAQTGKLFSNLLGKNNVTIPWNKIKKIGEDVILVEI